MPYVAPVKDMLFVMNELAGLADVVAYPLMHKQVLMLIWLQQFWKSLQSSIKTLLHHSIGLVIKIQAH